MKKIIFTLISVFMFVGCVNNINDNEENNIIEPAPIENNDIKEESPKLEPNRFECGDIVWDTVRKKDVFIDGSCAKDGVDVCNKINVSIEKSVYYKDGSFKESNHYGSNDDYNNDTNDDYNNDTFVAYESSKYKIILESTTFATIDIDAETNIATVNCYNNYNNYTNNNYNNYTDEITFIAYDEKSKLLTIKFNRKILIPIPSN